MVFRFAVPDGAYLLILHFAEIDDYAGPGDRVFDVWISV
jgi:hypothetical protein